MQQGHWEYKIMLSLQEGLGWKELQQLCFLMKREQRKRRRNNFEKPRERYAARMTRWSEMGLGWETTLLTFT